MSPTALYIKNESVVQLKAVSQIFIQYRKLHSDRGLGGVEHLNRSWQLVNN
jgi:hypothetical protein